MAKLYWMACHHQPIFSAQSCKSCSIPGHQHPAVLDIFGPPWYGNGTRPAIGGLVRKAASQSAKKGLLRSFSLVSLWSKRSDGGRAAMVCLKGIGLTLLNQKRYLCWCSEFFLIFPANIHMRHHTWFFIGGHFADYHAGHTTVNTLHVK